MNFSTLKQTKTILTLALAVALLGCVFYGGYRYWQSQQVVSESQESEELSGENIVDQHFNPQGEEAYRIVKNEDGTQTYTSFLRKFRITAPIGWEIGDAGNPNFAVGPAISVDDETRGWLGFFIIGFRDVEEFSSYKTRNTERSVRLSDEELNSRMVEVYEEERGEGAYPGGHRMLFFEGDNGTYVSIDASPLIFINEPEYQQILNSIEFFD